MLVKELLKNGKISLRTYNICREQKWVSLEDILDYHKKKGHFKGIKNCGKRSMEELLHLSSTEFSENLQNESIIKTRLMTSIGELTPLQKEIIEGYIKELTEELSPKSQEAILAYLQEDISLHSFYRFWENSDSNTIKYKGVGRRNALDVEIYFDKIKHFILEISQMKEVSKLLSIRKSYSMRELFPIEEIPIPVIELGFFKVVDYFLTYPALFDEHRIKFFPKAFKIFQESKEMRLREIAAEMQITHERVRQIRNELLRDIFKRLLVIRLFDDILLIDSGIDTSEEVLELSQKQVQSINEKSHTRFTKNFIYVILAIYLEKYEIVGELTDVLFPRFSVKKTRHNWQRVYLASQEITAHLDLDKLVGDISLRLSDKIDKQYGIPFQEYVSKYLLDKSVSVEQVKPLVLLVLKGEFGLKIQKEQIIIPRNTYKQIYEYAYEALELLGKPSSVDEIAGKVKEMYPETNISSMGIRSSLRRENGFTPIGRSSCFGLAKWEKSIKNFKGGTIRDIIKEYLEREEEPHSLKELTQYVVQYRPKTNSKSVLTNLKADASDTFVFFEKSLIGLKKKSYSAEYLLLPEEAPKKRSWKENYEAMEEFIRTYHRLPLSADKMPIAKILYRWMSVQRNLIKNGKIHKEREKLFKEIINSTNYEDITR